MQRERTLSAAQEVLLAAANIHEDVGGEFSEWDLSIASWKVNRNRFGMRGHEDDHPDHKRVMMEISKNKAPITQGWLQKVRQNRYEITPIGLAQAGQLRKNTRDGADSPKSAEAIYDVLDPYIKDETFAKWIQDNQAPVTWVSAQIFLRLRKIDKRSLEKSISAVDSAVELGLKHLERTGQHRFPRGSKGGGRFISKDMIEQLTVFVSLLYGKFAPQMDAIRRRG